MGSPWDHCRKPSFFVVGAPKCGTSFFYRYLRQQPDVFLPALRELHYFADDLDLKWRIDSPERYAALYEDARAERAVGDFSHFSLYSEVAPQRIKDFAPDAKIIILLRDPVEMMNSLHLQYISTYDEDITDFAQALEASEDRWQGRRVPANSSFGRCMSYRALATFSPHVERYFQTFDRRAIHVVLFDDLVADSAKTYRGTLEHLGVSLDRLPNLRPVNVTRRKRIVSRFTLRVRQFERYNVLRKLFKHVPHSLAAVYRAMEDKWLSPARSLELDPELRAKLNEEFRPEIEKLGALIGRDLSGWCQNEKSAASVPAPKRPPAVHAANR